MICREKKRRSVCGDLLGGRLNTIQQNLFKVSKVLNIQNADVLGDEGSKALDACVKVKIFGKPETRKYDFGTGLNRLMGCYASRYRGDYFPYPQTWLSMTEEMCRMLPTKETYDIIDIHNSLVRFDERSFVEKYPPEGIKEDKLKDLIDKQRSDIEREYKEATNNPDGQQRYSWTVAQRRVRDCFAGNFSGDGRTLRDKYRGVYNITDIYDAVVHYDETSFVKKYSEGNSEYVAAQRAEVEGEYKEAITKSDTDTEHTLMEYSQGEAGSRIKSCYDGFFSTWSSYTSRQNG